MINIQYLSQFSGSIIGAINGIIIPVLLAVAFLFFIWGIVNYFIFGAADSGKRAEGGTFMLWSIIGFAVIFSVWGLVWVVIYTVGIGPGGAPPPYPTL
ncbi:MAG TPA: hypothetical protein VMT80_01035 [Candidatus Paceibacterota bacterium]|nr:hypothetical protein [Candidatus Paceibacterota bacterium]